MDAETLKEKIREHTKEFGEIRTTRGAFGDTKPSVGVVEYIEPTEEGTFTKYFGCSIPFKGYPDLDLTEEMQLGKGFLSRIPREVFWNFWIFRIALLLMALFARKKFYKFLWRYSFVVRKQLEKLIEANPFLRSYKFSPFVKELKRAFYASLKKNGYSDPLNVAPDKKPGLGDILANIAEFFFLFVEFDTAYNLPLRDLMENVDKSNQTRKEFERLSKLFVERSRNLNAYNIRKFTYTFKIASKFLYIPEVKRIAKDFIQELDCDILTRDEADWYYCLDRLYDHRGLPLETRQEMKHKIDKEKGHIDLWQNYLEAKVDKDFITWILNE